MLPREAFVCLPATMDGRRTEDIKQPKDRIDGTPKQYAHDRYKGRDSTRIHFATSDLLWSHKCIESRPCNFVLPPSLSVNYSPFPSKDCPLREIENFLPSRPAGKVVRLRPSPFVRPVTVNPSLRLRNYKFGKPRSFPSHVGCRVACAGPAMCVSRNLWLESPLPFLILAGGAP